MKKALLLILFIFVTMPAHAILLTDTQSLGEIGDTDTDPGVPFTFNLGGTFSSISAVTFIFDPCDGCLDTIGTGEDVILTLGTDSFTISNVGFGNTITTLLSPSAALVSDLLDGSVSGLIWLHEKVGFNFAAAVSSADITLQVEGTTAVPEPGSLGLLAMGLIGGAFLRRRINS